ncbi:echinoidin-like [Apostichopus japonicus]|uniref:echinoidin-like n=1 Tax=Stichopus japonicus TaxID=307972 RepID=UPI003AB79BC6
MKVVLAIVLLFSVLAQSYSCRVCPVFWTQFQGHCYRYFGNPRLDFDKAQDYCQNYAIPTGADDCFSECSWSKVANLVTIESQAENNFTRDMFISLRHPGKEGQQVRIGLTDKAEEGKWVWASGSVLVEERYKYWSDRQPDNKEGNQDCAVIWQEHEGEWDDQDCASTRPFICEF